MTKKTEMLKKLVIPFCCLFLVFSCSKDQHSNTIENNENSENNEFLTQLKVEPDALTITAQVTDSFKLVSPYLKTATAVDSSTGKELSGYVVNSSYNPIDYDSDCCGEESGGGNITYGWFYWNDCLVYGKMFTADNGTTYFVPCGINCIGFDPVCPKGGDGMARKANSLVTLKFGRS